MVTDTTKLLVDAGSTVILAVTLLIAIYYLSRSQSAQSTATENEGEAGRLVAQSNLRLAEALDRFSVAALQATAAAREQKKVIDQNAAVLQTQQTKLEHVGNVLDQHATESTERDIATRERDQAASEAIDALPGQIQLRVQKDNNQLWLQIQIALNEFLQRLTPDQESTMTIKVDKDLLDPGVIGSPDAPDEAKEAA